GDRHQPLRHPPRGLPDRARAAAEDLDPAQTAARHGRDRRDGIPARQDEELQVQRRVLLLDEALTRRFADRQTPRIAGRFFVALICTGTGAMTTWIYGKSSCCFYSCSP